MSVQNVERRYDVWRCYAVSGGMLFHCAGQTVQHTADGTQDLPFVNLHDDINVPFVIDPLGRFESSFVFREVCGRTSPRLIDCLTSTQVQFEHAETPAMYSGRREYLEYLQALPRPYEVNPSTNTHFEVPRIVHYFVTDNGRGIAADAARR